MDKTVYSITYKSGVFLVLLAGTFWSSMGLGVRLIEQANVWQILFYRSLALAPFLFFIITIRSNGAPFVIIKKAGIASILGGLGLVLAFSGGIFAIQATSVANAMFLFAAAPFLTAFLGWFLLAEAIRRETWVYMGFAVLGVLVMVWNGILIGHLEGNLSALISALGFSIFTIALRWGKLEDMLPTVFLAGIFSICISGLLCFFLNFPFVISVTDAGIAMCLGVFQVGLGLTVYTLGSKVVPAAELALLSMTEVVLGPIWVWLFLGEKADFMTLLGGSILLAAILGNAVSGIINSNSIEPLQ